MILFLGCLLNGLGAFLCRKLNMLTISGAAAAFLIGLTFFAFGDVFLWMLLLFFFCSSAGISLLKRLFHFNRHSSIVPVEKKGRNGFQVLANTFVPALFLCLFSYLANPLYLFVCIASLAESTSDTWASEIGILSRKKPRSILSGKESATGLSGSVSLLGTCASILGAGAMVTAAFVFSFFSAKIPAFTFTFFAVCCIAAFLGNLFDSLLGGVLQEKFMGRDGQVTEIRPQNEGRNQLVNGIYGIDNNQVNFLSNCFSALLTIMLLIS